MMKQLVFLCFAVATAKRVQDRVSTLPLLNKPPLLTEVYSGFYPVAPSRHIHYVFVESESNPATDPIVVFF